MMKKTLAATLALAACALAFGGPGDTTTSHDPMPSTGGTITGERPANPDVPAECALIWTGKSRLVDVDPISNDILEERAATSNPAVFRVMGDPGLGIVGEDDHSGDESDGVAEIKVRWEYRVECDSGSTLHWIDCTTIDVGW